MNMGYISHHAMVVTGYRHEEADETFQAVYEKAVDLFEDLVSPIIPTKRNGFQSFLIAPDGSKEGWDLSNEYNEKRKILGNFIDAQAYDDGSNDIQFVEVGYNEEYEAFIERTNKQEGEIFE
jgi:hypothetical protein